MTRQELQATFIRLNNCWGLQWPGLQRIMNSCLIRFGQRPSAVMGNLAQAIHDCMQDVAKLIEGDGQARAALNQESEYHNRLHVANTLEALTTLLLLQRQYSDAERTIPPSMEWQPC